MGNFLRNIKYVVENSKHVSINRVKILDFCNYFKHTHIKHWLDEAPFDLSELNDEDRLNFLLIFNSISFSYWGDPKWTILYKDKKYDGSWAMIASIGRAIKNKIPIIYPRYLVNLTEKDFERILKGNCKIPLFNERLKILRDVGKILINKYGGEFANLVKEAKGDAIKLVELIVENFPGFNDFAEYKGRKVFFSKRAQLLVADIYQIFHGKKYGMLKNIDKLTACADYKLPQILRKLEIFSYSQNLAKKIDNKKEIEEGSKEEVEIRANTIWAVELIKKELKKKMPNVNSIHVNDHIWLLSQKKFPKDKPYHLTRTSSY